MSNMSSGVVAVLVGLMFCLGLLFGSLIHTSSINSDCRNVGKSYTATYVLICEAKK